MILIADSGSTKTEWCLADQGRPVRTVVTAGTNPYFQTREEIAGEIRGALLPALRGERIDAIYFYGAGCAFPEKNRIVEEAITPYIPAPIEVYSDLMAAARALCGNRPGIACILGTGSNSCLYDGTEITEHISPLGFILGDEGSGAVLGKLLVGDCLKRQLPAPLVQKFMDQYELTPALLLERVNNLSRIVSWLPYPVSCWRISPSNRFIIWSIRVSVAFSSVTWRYIRELIRTRFIS